MSDQLSEFSNKLSPLTDYEIIEIFNRETQHNGWGKSRSIFLIALKGQFDDRNIDYSEIGDDEALSFKHKVKLIDKKIFRI